jgi:hypothetical protein
VSKCLNCRDCNPKKQRCFMFSIVYGILPPSKTENHCNFCRDWIRIVCASDVPGILRPPLDGVICREITSR